jgi:hypothetical protein
VPAVLGHGVVQRTIDVPLSEEEEELLVERVKEIKKWFGRWKALDALDDVPCLKTKVSIVEAGHYDN